VLRVVREDPRDVRQPTRYRLTKVERTNEQPNVAPSEVADERYISDFLHPAETLTRSSDPYTVARPIAGRRSHER
jgi:hypothetical protein